MQKLPVSEARANFSKLLKLVNTGEPVIIEDKKNGRMFIVTRIERYESFTQRKSNVPKRYEFKQFTLPPQKISEHRREYQRQWYTRKLLKEK
jgi:prevent-host-death family protein